MRAGFETAGYTVIGTATSGQAAKALGEGAGIESRTMASLTWRLEHGRAALTPRHVFILDEGGMTADVDWPGCSAAVEARGQDDHRRRRPPTRRRRPRRRPGGPGSRHPGHVGR